MCNLYTQQAIYIASNALVTHTQDQVYALGFSMIPNSLVDIVSLSSSRNIRGLGIIVCNENDSEYI